MSLTMVIVILAVAAIVALAMLAGDGGPRITQITRRREKQGDDDA